MPTPEWPKCKIEIYERDTFGFLDDHFRSGWVKIRSAASESFVNYGGLVADLGVMSVTESGTSNGAGWEKGSLNISTDIYKKFRARLKGLGYSPMYDIHVKYSDASETATGWTSAPLTMSVITLTLTAGKTVTAIQIFVRAGNGANNQSATLRIDYVALIKEDPITPTEIENLDVELAATTAISGFKFALLNHKGIYTEKPSVGNVIFIYLGANIEDLEQKILRGWITDKQPSGDPDNPIVTIVGEDMGSVFNDRTFTKKYTSATFINKIAEDIQTQELTELTGFEGDPDTDNSITPEFNEEEVFNLLKKLADTARKGTTYGYDFYVDPAGCLKFVKNPNYTCSEKIYAGMFYDDFRGNLDKWEVKSGSWAIENEELSQSDQSDGSKVILAGNPQWTNFKFEARVKIIEVPAPDGDRTAGVIFRRKDDSNYYYLLIAYQSAYTHFRLMKIVGGNWYDIQDASATINLGQWYDFKVEVNGTSIKCYLDGTLKINVTDSDIDKGRIGCIAARSHSHFDNVSVKAYNEPPYNIKRFSWKEIIEDVGNEIKLLIREGEYDPHDKDSWTENTERWSSPDGATITADADKKEGSYSIKGEISGAGLTLRLRREIKVDKSKFKKIKFWLKWSLTGPVDFWRIRITDRSDYSQYFQREYFVGQSAPASKDWSTMIEETLANFTKTGNVSEDIVSVEIALRNSSQNLGDGVLMIDGLYFAYDPVYKTASDSISQNKYGKKKRNFEDFTITDPDFAQYMANALCQALKNPIKYVHVVVPGKAQEGYRPPAQVIVSSAKDNIHYEYFKILKARHHYITSREEAPLYICDLDLIAAKKTDGTYEVPIAKEPPGIRALKPISVISPLLKAISRKGYYWY